MGTENLILLLIEAGFYFVFMVGLLHLRHQLGIGVFVAALGVMHFLETYLAAASAAACAAAPVLPAYTEPAGAMRARVRLATAGSGSCTSLPCR